MRRSSRLAVPLLRPEDVIPHLGKPSHWKQGRSAKSLADKWFFDGAFPPAIQALLNQSPCLAAAEMLDGWLERETDLRDGRSTPSQTDLLALIGIGDELAVLGIEAKVDESFGPLVSEWLKEATTGKRDRLASLCDLFRLPPAAIGHLRYQLLHRTAATVLEAKRFRARKAVLIVQSFCPKATGLSDATAFCKAIGLSGLERDRLIGPAHIAGVDLWVGWAADTVPAPRENMSASS